MAQYDLKRFAEAVTEMCWADLNRVAKHIADCSNQTIEDGMEIDAHYMGHMLTDMAREVLDDLEKQRAAEPAA